jgi:hypothetical protein
MVIHTRSVEIDPRFTSHVNTTSADQIAVRNDRNETASEALGCTQSQSWGKTDAHSRQGRNGNTATIDPSQKRRSFA